MSILLSVLLKLIISFGVFGLIAWFIIRAGKKASRAANIGISQVVSQHLAQQEPVVCGHCEMTVERARSCSNCGAPLP